MLEINEVPWKLLALYQDDSKYPHIVAFFKKAKLYTSVAVDEGELSPWITWPTLHRGLPNTKHGVSNLGQDPKTFRGVPIWQEYRLKGESIGIFGSLQSWPPIDPGPLGFYVPDTFAHDEQCIPKLIEPIQRFNLDQVAQNGRVINSSPLKSILNIKFIFALLASGLRPKTLFKFATQIIAEKFNPEYRARRAIFQGILFWDIFRKLYDPTTPPMFSTFFTNHIASVIHRYWHHVFPNDFPEELRPKKLIHKNTMNFAFKVLDQMLGDVSNWMKQNPDLTVIFATSMGQDTVIRSDHRGYELTVTDLSKLIASSGCPLSEFKNLLAMAPQSAVEIKNPTWRKHVSEFLLKIKSPSGVQMFSTEEIGPSLSLTVHIPTPEDCKSGQLILPNGLMCMMSDLGIKAWQVEAGTAYHIPEGIFAVLGPGARAFDDISPNEMIQTDKLKQRILKAANF